MNESQNRNNVRGQRMSAYIGAQKLLDAYFNMLKR